MGSVSGKIHMQIKGSQRLACVVEICYDDRCHIHSQSRIKFHNEILFMSIHNCVIHTLCGCSVCIIWLLKDL